MRKSHLAVTIFSLIGGTALLAESMTITRGPGGSGTVDNRGDVVIPQPDNGTAQFPDSADGRVSDIRCSQDSLNPEQSRQRLIWAGSHNIIPRHLVEKWLYRIENGKPVMNSRPYYPMFGKWNGNPRKSKIWFPEKHDMPRSVPAPNVWITVCRASCYTQEQALHTDEGLIPMEEAEQYQHPELLTVDPSSTRESLSFLEKPVDRYTVSFTETWHPILTFTTASGGQIKVTPNHPLVDQEGIMREAANFSIGDALVHEDGGLDPIISIESSKFFYNSENLF